MYIKLFSFFLLAGLLSSVPARADAARKQLKTCQDTCHIEHMACEFDNDLDTCQSRATTCAQQCDHQYPAVAVCMSDCESELTFCRQDGYSLETVCLEEKASCTSRCEARSTVSSLER
jgi:hypothetical protein